MPRVQPHRSTRGLTLIELMIGLAVLALLISLAAPSFRQALARSRLSSAASEFTAAVQLARAEAIRANRRAVLCRSADGSACNNSAGAWTAWILFVDTDGDGTRGASEAVLQRGSFDGPLQVNASTAIVNAGQRITFRGDGLARAADGTSLLTGTLSVCLPVAEPAENVRDVSLAFGSRAAVRRRNGGGSCTSPSDS